MSASFYPIRALRTHAPSMYDFCLPRPSAIWGVGWPLSPSFRHLYQATRIQAQFQSCSQASSLFNSYPHTIARTPGSSRQAFSRGEYLCGFCNFHEWLFCGGIPSHGLAGYARGYARRMRSRASRIFATNERRLPIYYSLSGSFFSSTL